MAPHPQFQTSGADPADQRPSAHAFQAPGGSAPGAAAHTLGPDPPAAAAPPHPFAHRPLAGTRGADGAQTAASVATTKDPIATTVNSSSAAAFGNASQLTGVHASPRTRLPLPVVVLTNDTFFSSDGFDPSLFNLWYRRNGWQRPLHALFIVHIICWIMIACFYYIVVLRFIQPTNTRIALYIFSSIITSIELLFVVLTISIDPQDPVVRKANVPRNVNYVKRTSVPVIDPDTRFCNICQVHVGHQTKHCKPCNKCVGKYDHHCVYLSTCIGRPNYKPFFVALVFGSIIIYTIISVTFYPIVLYFINRDAFVATVFDVFQTSTDSAVLAVMVSLFIFFVFTAVVASAVTYMLVFHARIRYVGITTVGYLESRHARGPTLWSINTREHRDDVRRAKEYSINHPNQPTDINDLKSVIV